MLKRHAIPAIFALVLAYPSARALVGNAPEISDAGRYPEVMLVGSRGNFFTGVAIARDLVLAVAHGAQAGSEYKRLTFDAGRQPVLTDVVSVVRHPQFSLETLLAHRATADVALLKLATPVAAAPVPLGRIRGPVSVGDSFIVRGYGLAARGDGRSGGKLRSATLVATGKPGNLQLRLVDPRTGGNQPGLGACTGDSGAPVYQDNGGRLEVIGVVSWSTGPGNTAGCGGTTGVTPIELYRGWIVETARKMGSAVAP